MSEEMKIHLEKALKELNKAYGCPEVSPTSMMGILLQKCMYIIAGIIRIHNGK